jgi:hypothetical protein
LLDGGADARHAVFVHELGKMGVWQKRGDASFLCIEYLDAETLPPELS